MKFVIIFILVTSSLQSFADVANPFQSKAELICSQIIENPKLDYESNFSDKFRKAVPYNSLVGVLKDLFSQGGSCVRVEVKIKSELVAKFIAVTQKDKKMIFSLVLDGAKSKIDSFWYSGNLTSDLSLKNYDELKAQLSKLSGQVSASVKFFDEATPRFSYQADARQALGSEFKLYVLGTLVDQIKSGQHTWAEKYAIQDSLKSLPSGTMQNEVSGATFTLNQFAAKMISISDNTAADHLLDLVGHENVEKNMTPAINSFAKDNQPFLSTMEMFRSRTMKESEVDQYVLASAAERLKILLLQKQNISREQLLDLLKTWETPRFIDKIEWYASTNDMCNVMQWLKQKDSQEMLDILSINVPLVDTDFNKMVKYAGYKGGSEPGVLTMSYLFQTQDSKWGCFSFAENDVKKSIDQNSAFQTVQAAMELVLRPQIQTNHHVK